MPFKEQTCTLKRNFNNFRSKLPRIEHVARKVKINKKHPNVWATSKLENTAKENAYISMRSTFVMFNRTQGELRRMSSASSWIKIAFTKNKQQIKFCTTW
jgi:hypothetical protein